MAKFNLSRYQELLTKTNSLNKEGIEVFQDPVFLELLSCRASIETQIFYGHKNEYFDLIQKYLGERMTPNQFSAQFIGMAEENIKKSKKTLQNFEELATFWVQPGLEEFASLLQEIHDTCLCVVEYGTGDEGISEDRFRDSIEKTFLQMGKYSLEGN